MRSPKGPRLDQDLFLGAFAAPEAPKTNLEFARTMRIPDGPRAGEMFDPGDEPAQFVLTQVLDGQVPDCQGKPFKEIVYGSAVQTGKSLTCIILPAMRNVAGLGTSVVYCLPSLDLLTKTWTGKLEPAIRGSGFSAWLPERGPGSQGGRPAVLRFQSPTGGPAGMWMFMAGGEGEKRESGQASVTAGLVLLDEVDEYETSHRVALVKQRASAFGASAVFLMTSTVKKDGKSVILGLLKESTNSRLHFACPFCDAFQVLTWDNVRYEGEDDIAVKASARYFCNKCGVGWTDEDRHRALTRYRLVHQGQTVNEAGEVEGPTPRTLAFGLVTTQLDFHIGYGLGDLAVQHRRAVKMIEEANDHGLMRSFTRDRLTSQYRGDLIDDEGERKQIDEKWLQYLSLKSAFGPVVLRTEKGRFSSYWVPETPMQITFLTVAIDVQQDRVYWAVTGWDRFDSSYDLAWGYRFAGPQGDYAATADLHGCLDIVAHEVSEGPPGGGWGNSLAIVRAGIDVGYRQSDIEPWLARNPSWYAVKGIGERQANGMATTLTGLDVAEGHNDIRGTIYPRRSKSGLMIYFVETLSVREKAQGAYLTKPSSPGGAHLPQGIKASDAYIRHLCSWRLDVHPKTLEKKWVRKQLRDDYLACKVYNFALGKFHVEQVRRYGPGGVAQPIDYDNPEKRKDNDDTGASRDPDWVNASKGDWVDVRDDWIP